MIPEMIITDIKRGIVASRPKQMYAWPGIIQISKDEILVAASERREHRGPSGREVVIRSVDGGKTWGLPQEVYNSELDDRDANLAILSDGTLILSWFTAAAFDKVNPERYSRVTRRMRDELMGSWMCLSKDNGHSWTCPQRMPGGVHISPVVLGDDTLITVDTNSTDEDCLAVYKSGDLGKSWGKMNGIPCLQRWSAGAGGNRFLLNENHIIETSPGKLFAMFRSDPLGNGYLYQSFSEDGGQNWSEPRSTGIEGFPPHLLRLSNGVVMCSYSYRGTPHSIRAVFSYDEGRSWDTDNIVTLYEWEDCPDMGYPVSIETTPGNILMVFYCSYAMHANPNPYNLPEGIMSLSFKISI